MSLNKQPYISWKGPSTISATSTWSRPLTNQTITTDPEAAEVLAERLREVVLEALEDPCEPCFGIDIVHLGGEVRGGHDRTAHALDDTVLRGVAFLCLAHVSLPPRPSGRYRSLV